MKTGSSPGFGVVADIMSAAGARADAKSKTGVETGTSAVTGLECEGEKDLDYGAGTGLKHRAGTVLKSQVRTVECDGIAIESKNSEEIGTGTPTATFALFFAGQITGIIMWQGTT